jgi:DNA modification methylase
MNEEQAKLYENEERKRKEPNETRFSDLDLTKWKEFKDILTDSLWLLGGRDKTSVHSGEYWGNFVPQIPNQALRRFTKRGEIVLDGFLGLGTTLIECKKLGRHGIGIELNEPVAERAKSIVSQAWNEFDTETKVIVGDSALEETARAVRTALKDLGAERAQLIILHPPYHDIISFGNNPADLSNQQTEDAFYGAFDKVMGNLKEFLDKNRYLVLVIGDIYKSGVWIPLGFRTMDVVLNHGFTLKSVCVKDIQGNRGKRNQEKLWRYRALKGGFYIFKHEYVMFFVKD